MNRRKSTIVAAILIIVITSLLSMASAMESLAAAPTVHDNTDSSYITPFSSTGGTFYFNITEKGLPSGTNWEVQINGTNHLIAGNLFSTTYNTGTIVNYTILDTKMYYTNVSKGSATIANSNVNVNIQFEHFSYIEGRINPSNATLTLNGIYMKSTNGTFNFTVEQGTFDLKAVDIGFNTYYKNFTINSGQTLNLTINLTRTASTPQNNTLPPPTSNSDLIYASAGGIAAVAVGLIVYIYYRRSEKQ